MSVINRDLKTSRDRRLMLFDLALGGHHGNYICYLVDYWCEHNLPGYLDIVVVPKFKLFHADVVETIAHYRHPKIKLIEIEKSEVAALNSRASATSRIARNLQEWELYCRYALLRRATHSLLMYLDTSEIPLTIGRSSPCPFSGIYFRPTFHYGNFTNYQPLWKERLQQIRERFTLSRILAHPQSSNIFCLDPFAVQDLNVTFQTNKVAYLADPVEVERFRQPEIHPLKLAIEPGRLVFLLFGALDGRKGIYQLLEALNNLSADLCRRVCLLLVGGTNAAEQAQIEAKLDRVRQNKPLQAIARYEFVSEREVTAYFQLADVILAPYQKHVGMSGILLLAAAANKPVLSSDYGLMGKVVQRYQLGLSVDSTNPGEIARGLTQFLTQPANNYSDRQKMQTLVEQHSTKNYAETIFSHLDY